MSGVTQSNSSNVGKVDAGRRAKTLTNDSTPVISAAPRLVWSTNGRLFGAGHTRLISTPSDSPLFKMIDALIDGSRKLSEIQTLSGLKKDALAHLITKVNHSIPGLICTQGQDLSLGYSVARYCGEL